MSKRNFHRIENAFIFAKENAIQSFAMNLLKNTGNASDNQGDFEYTYNELIEFYSLVGELEVNYGIQVFNDYNTGFRDNSDAAELCEYNDDALICGASKSNIVIGADKRIYPCSMVESALETKGYLSPSIDDVSLYEAFHNAPQFHFFKHNPLEEICSICDPYLPMLNQMYHNAVDTEEKCLDCNRCQILTS